MDGIETLEARKAVRSQPTEFKDGLGGTGLKL